MAIGSNSYGSVAEIEALAPQYTDDGIFTATTRPTRAQVEKFTDRVSAVLNVLLAEEGFDIPVDEADPKLALDDFCVAQVVLLCHGANRAGAYAPGSESLRGRTPFQVILREAEGFIAKHADGIELLGATRTRNATYGLACRTEDDGGDDIVPFFDRQMMDNEITDWDT